MSGLNDNKQPGDAQAAGYQAGAQDQQTDSDFTYRQIIMYHMPFGKEPHNA